MAEKKSKVKNMDKRKSEEVNPDRKRLPVPDNMASRNRQLYSDYDVRSVTEKLAEIVRADIKPMELLAALERSSSAVWVLWMHLVAIPATRPELRSLLCHIWDGAASDTQLAEVLGVHRHTIRNWKRELYQLIDDLPIGSVTGIEQ